MISIVCFLFYTTSAVAQEPGFWNTQQKGANCFNKTPTEQWFRDAKDLGLDWVRLAYDKWDSEHRDFLIGDASNYDGLVEKGLNRLKQVILWAKKYDIKLVIAPLSLPGSRYSQNNSFQHDTRLWESYKYWDQAVRFWKDLSTELQDYTNIVAYNIVNEPHPEFGAGVEEHKSQGDVSRFIQWYTKAQDTPRDIYKFYQRIIKDLSSILK